MKTEEILAAMRRLKVETGSLACMPLETPAGRGHRHPYCACKLLRCRGEMEIAAR